MTTVGGCVKTLAHRRNSMSSEWERLYFGWTDPLKSDLTPPDNLRQTFRHKSPSSCTSPSDTQTVLVRDVRSGRGPAEDYSQKKMCPLGERDRIAAQRVQSGFRTRSHPKCPESECWMSILVQIVDIPSNKTRNKKSQLSLSDVLLYEAGCSRGI